MSSTLADKLKERRSRVDALRVLRNPAINYASANSLERSNHPSYGDLKKEDSTATEREKDASLSLRPSDHLDKTVEYKGRVIQKQIYEEAHAMANEGKDLSELLDEHKLRETPKTNYDDNFKRELAYYLYQEEIETTKRLNKIIENENKV